MKHSITSCQSMLNSPNNITIIDNIIAHWRLRSAQWNCDYTLQQLSTINQHIFRLFLVPLHDNGGEHEGKLHNSTFLCSQGSWGKEATERQTFVSLCCMCLLWGFVVSNYFPIIFTPRVYETRPNNLDGQFVSSTLEYL